MAIKERSDATVEILQIRQATVTFYVLGKTPMCMNRLPKKAREELLWPKRRQNRAARESVLKHDPVSEYRDAIYRCREPTAPTLVHLPSNAFKKAIAQAALRIPGATKAEIGQLVQVADPTVYVYGVPYLSMMVVRQAGINRVPDIRTRAWFPEWACKVQFVYFPKLILEKNVLNLFSAAGMITGVGDGRPEKGTFDWGQWEVVGADDKRWNAIVSKQGRKAQEAAMAAPQAADLDTEELLAWFQAETVRREQEPAAPPKAASTKRRKGRDGEREATA